MDRSPLGWHINCLELLAVPLALRFLRFLLHEEESDECCISHPDTAPCHHHHAASPRVRRCVLRGGLQGRDILVHTDNTENVAYINRQGGLRSCCNSPTTSSSGGVFNRPADELSRAALPGEWRLHPQAVQLIWRRFGVAQVDLFAFPETTHCQWFYSLTEATLGTDALAHSWPRSLHKYAFPLVVQVICAKFEVICSLFHESMKLGTVVQIWDLKIFRNGANAKTPCGCHGDHFAFHHNQIMYFVISPEPYMITQKW